MSILSSMGRKKIASQDRHKPRRMAAIRRQFHDAADQLAKKLGVDLTELVNMSLRETLERHGLWPPASKKDSS